MQNWHQGAYRATSVSLSRGPSSREDSAALSRPATAPLGHRSAASLRSSSPEAEEMLPLCRPHSFCDDDHRRGG